MYLPTLLYSERPNGAARDFDQPGVAILLNEFNGKIDATIFIFPYRNDAGQPGMQALMLPANQHEHYIDRAFIAMLFLICKDDNSPVLSLKCPNEVRMVGATEILGVYTEAEQSKSYK